MSDQSNAFGWQEAAMLLSEQTGFETLHCDAERFLSRSECRCILVACSGGADSVFMLCRLWARREALGIQPVVAHYNHRWRGEDSESDARFVETMARQLECPFVMETRPEDVSAMTETRARALRIDFLRAAAREQGCQCIAFGHQQDDILETQLQRLARGSGTEGLAAPRPVHYFNTYPTHIRPLLHLKACVIRELLESCSIPWCEDASNKDVSIPRNAVRHSVIPSLQDALERDVSKGAARSRCLLEEDAVALDQFARQLLPEAFRGSDFLDRASICSVPRALARRALIAWVSLHPLSGFLSAAAVDQLVEAIYTEKELFRLSAGAAFITADSTTIRMESADLPVLPLEPCQLEAGESILLSTGALLETEIITVDEALRKLLSEGAVNVASEAYVTWTPGQTFNVRPRRPGDTFRPLGAPGHKKLKDWFIDRQFPAKERNQLPLVVTRSETIVWVPGLPPADDLKINESTKLALKLTYKTRKNNLTD